MLLQVLDEIIAALCALAVLSFMGVEDMMGIGMVMVTGLTIWLFKVIFLYDLDES